MQKIIVGLSGGVDSSVAAYILKKQGYEVEGLYMKNWDDSQFTLMSDCSYAEDRDMAEMVARSIGIPFHEVDLTAEYRERVVEYLFQEYRLGRTPNPDILCNREVKFDLFVKEAFRLGADKVATGHYARVDYDGSTQMYTLKAGKDSNKDQSYFLAQLNPDQLAYAFFPLGALEKHEVRALAGKANLPAAQRKDSQGICFIGKVSLPEFLQQRLASREGPIINVPGDGLIAIDNEASSDDYLSYWSKPYKFSHDIGKEIGKHKGAHFFTVGQRRGLGVGGTGEPLFVIATDTQMNTVYTGVGKKHPGLYRHGLYIYDSDVHWIRPDLALQEGESRTVLSRIRYRQPLQRATLYKRQGCYLIFDEPQRAIAPGQFAAWYHGDEIIGSGVIAE